jgi:hypothetical protein
MEITLKRHRYNTIYKWKSRGLIYPDYDELYQTYINTLECQHCLKEFKSTLDRQMDHCHVTGEFRKIVCKKCNIYDTYIKYPNGYTEEDKKQRKSHKHTCDCGGKYTNNHKAYHFKTQKHKKYYENNN